MTAFVYVVFVPRKYEINSPRYKRFLQAAAARNINLLVSSMNSREFDVEMKTGVAAETIFELRQCRPFHSIRRVWIVGGGSSMYARGVIRLALSPEHAIPVSHLTPEGSCLTRYIQTLQGGHERFGSEVGRGRLVLVSR